jgi:hypothetical protein
VSDLFTVTGDGSYFTAAGENSTIVHGTADGPPSVYQLFDEKDIISISWERNTTFFMGTTSDGTVFQGSLNDGEIFVCDNRMQLEHPSINGQFFACEEADSYLVLQENDLVGFLDCYNIAII